MVYRAARTVRKIQIAGERVIGFRANPLAQFVRAGMRVAGVRIGIPGIRIAAFTEVSGMILAYLQAGSRVRVLMRMVPTATA